MDYLFKKLTESIKLYDKVVIMTHRHPDLDGIASSIAIHQIVKNFKKECHIVLPTEEINDSLIKALKLLEKNNITINFLKEDKTNNLISDNNLLVILDLAKPNLVENRKLLEMKNIIVIDHHPKAGTKIPNTIIEYIDETKSSIIEIMTEYLKYLNIKLHPIILTLMLAGLEVDTNTYHYKTSEKTFVTAAYLTRNGANTSLKNEILKNSREEVIKRNTYINQSFFLKEGFIVCNAEEIGDISQLAILADELLKIDKVEVSFAIGQTNDRTVHISARSMGNISANEIMKALGGGGHITAAAAQIKQSTIDQTIEMLNNIITEG